MLKSFDLTVYAVPVPWHRAGQNRATGVSFKQGVDREAQYAIRAAWMQEFAYLGILSGPLRLAVTAFLPCPKGMSRKRRRTAPLPTTVPDVDNLAKQVKDALSRYAFADDKQIVTLLARKRYALSPEGDDTPPRWQITIEVIEEKISTDEAHIVGLWGVEGPDYHNLGRGSQDRPAPEGA